MAVLWFTGFEGGTTTDEPFGGAPVGSVVSVGTSYARSGDFGCRLNAAVGATGSAFFRACSNTDGSIASGFAADTRINFWIKVITLPTDAKATVEEMFLNSNRGGSYESLTLTIDSDGKIGVYICDTDASPPSNTLLGRSSTAINDGVWHAVQLKDDYTGGSPTHDYELIIDDVSEVSGSTSSIATNNVANIYIGKYVDKFDDKGYDLYIDDVAIASDAYVTYPYSIERVVPDSAGTYENWSRTGGGSNNWEALDDLTGGVIVPDGDTTYLSSSVSDERESVLCESCTSVSLGKQIAAVKTSYVVKRGGAGDQTKFFIRDSGGTNRDTSSAITVTSAYKAYATLWETNPATGAAWNAAEINLTELGMLNINPEVWATRWSTGQLHILYGGLAGTPMIAYNFGG